MHVHACQDCLPSMIVPQTLETVAMTTRADVTDKAVIKRSACNVFSKSPLQGRLRKDN